MAVEYVSLPHYLRGFQILAPTPQEDQDIRNLVGKELQGNVKVHVLESEGKRFYVVGILLGLSENDWELFESPLEFHHVPRALDVPRPIISVDLDVSGPAKWVIDHGSGPFAGFLVDHDQEYLLAKLLRPIKYGMSYPRVVLARAINSEHFEAEFGKVVNCQLFPVRDMEIFSLDPSEALKSAKRWMEFDNKGGLVGSITIQNKNYLYFGKGV